MNDEQAPPKTATHPSPPATDASSNWLEIESAPKDGTRILAAGPYRRADWGDPPWIEIIYWNTVSEVREVAVGDGLYRKEMVVTRAYWAPGNNAGRVDFEPEWWMPLPSPPEDRT